MEKEIEIRAKIIKAIKSNASPNAITRYWEMSTDDIEEAAAEIFEALIWHGPDVVPGRAVCEDVVVINQSGEKVIYDMLDDNWYSADTNREAYVEKWCYPKQIKAK